MEKPKHFSFEDATDGAQNANKNAERSYLPLGFQPGVWSVICGKGKESYSHSK